MSESDVYRRQILTSKDSPRTERVTVLPTGRVVLLPRPTTKYI